MKSLSPLIAILILLSPALGCGAEFGATGKNKESKDSDQTVATRICNANGDCVSLSCDEIIALDNAGQFEDEVRKRYEDVIARCHNRASSHDLQPENEPESEGECPDVEQSA